MPADTPGGIRRLLRRCLQKDPKLRLHDIRDARLEIDDVRSATTQNDGVASGRSGRRERLAWASALALVALIAGVLGVWALRPAPTAPEVAARDQHAADQGSVAGDFARWTEDRLRGQVRRPVSVVAAVAGFSVGAAVGRNRARIIPVLVARQPVHRVHCGYQAEAHGHRRRIAADTGVRHSSGSRGRVEQRRHDRLFARTPADRFSASPPRVVNRPRRHESSRRNNGVIPSRSFFPMAGTFSSS